MLKLLSLEASVLVTSTRMTVPEALPYIISGTDPINSFIAHGPSQLM